MAHQRLNLQNLRIDEQGYLKICEGGQAYITQMSLHKTLDFVSPEMVSDPKSYHQSCVIKQVDWWAVGCLMYRLAYGQTPFWHPDVRQMGRKILKEEVSFPKLEGGMLFSDQFRDLIKQCLSKDSEQRYGFH